MLQLMANGSDCFFLRFQRIRVQFVDDPPSCVSYGLALFNISPLPKYWRCCACKWVPEFTA
jgi:hypothetical protein